MDLFTPVAIQMTSILFNRQDRSPFFGAFARQVILTAYWTVLIFQ